MFDNKTVVSGGNDGVWKLFKTTILTEIVG